MDAEREQNKKQGVQNMMADLSKASDKVRPPNSSSYFVLAFDELWGNVEVGVCWLLSIWGRLLCLCVCVCLCLCLCLCLCVSVRGLSGFFVLGVECGCVCVGW